jgi:predicted DsbA family dithiol-disulfide isomerase
MTARIAIDIWSDVMCPWCVIGYKQLETALAELEGEIEAEIRWLPFELNPDMPAHGEDSEAHIARKYGRTPEQARASREAMAERARAAGYSFVYTGEGEPPRAMMWNTFAAHKLLRWALAEHGPAAQTRLKLALFDAHFQQRRPIGEAEVLLDIAETQGFDRTSAAAALDDEALGAEVRAEERRAWEHNITGVPAMVLDGKFLVPGAQDAATYVNVIRRAVERRSATG